MNEELEELRRMVFLNPYLAMSASKDFNGTRCNQFLVEEPFVVKPPHYTSKHVTYKLEEVKAWRWVRYD